MASLNYVKSVLPRAVHIKVHPQPQNIRETRAILRVLKDFGEVDSFRSLRNDPIAPAPNVILAVFRNAESATRLIDEAPLQFEIAPPVEPADGLRGLVGVQASDSTITRIDTDADAKGENLGGAPKTRQFHLTVKPSNFDHQAHIRRQEYYWGFRSNQSSTQLTLARSVPLDALSNISLQQTQIPTRIVNRLMDEVTSRKTLRQLAEESSRGTTSSHLTSDEDVQKDVSLKHEHTAKAKDKISNPNSSSTHSSKIPRKQGQN